MKKLRVIPGRERSASRLLAVIVLWTFAFGAAAQVSPPPPAAPRQASVPQPVERTLENGLRVIVVPKPGVPLVSARLMVRTGSEADPRGLGGVAQLTASLLTQGTKTRNATQIARAVEALGAELQAQASFDASVVDVNAIASNFGKAMEFLADVTRNPVFAQAELDRVRSQAVDELNVAMSEPGSLASFVATRVVFGETPYGHNAGGTPESLARIDRDAIKAFHSRHYVPENSVLVVAGAVAADEAFRTASSAFGTWKRGSGEAAAASREESAPGKARVLVVDMPEAGQAAVVVARRGIRRVDPAYFSAVVANSVLGGGYSSRLNQEVRIKRGLSYGAGSAFEPRREAGPFVARTQTKNESADEVAALIVDELNRLGSTDIVETELGPRKAVLIGGFSESLETGRGIVSRIANLALHGIDLTEINRYIGSVQAVTPKAVRDFAAQNLAGASASVVVVGDAKQFLDPLKARFGEVEVIPAAALDLNAESLRK